MSTLMDAAHLFCSALELDELTVFYRRVRQTSLRLGAPLSDADASVQSMPDASPAKWHLAHTSWFFEQFLLMPELAGYRPFHPDYAYLFNSYYYSVGEMHPRPIRGVLSRPAHADILAYRAHVDAHMQALLAARGTDPAITARVSLGLNHEQQHQELLLMDLKHLFSLNPLRPV